MAWALGLCCPVLQGLPRSNQDELPFIELSKDKSIDCQQPSKTSGIEKPLALVIAPACPSSLNRSQRKIFSRRWPISLGDHE